MNVCYNGFPPTNSIPITVSQCYHCSTRSGINDSGTKIAYPGIHSYTVPGMSMHRYLREIVGEGGFPLPGLSGPAQSLPIRRQAGFLPQGVRIATRLLPDAGLGPTNYPGTVLSQRQAFLTT